MWWTRREKRDYAVVFDAGHGGKDDGAINGEVKEKDINLSVVKKIVDVVASGDYLFSALSTRFTDRYLPLTERLRLVKQKRPQIFVSIHCDFCQDESISGFEIFYGEGTRVLSHALAEDFEAELAISEVYRGHKSRGVTPSHFYILTQAPCPAVLIKLEFLSNPEMVKFLINQENQLKIAKAIADAIQYFLED